MHSYDKPWRNWCPRILRTLPNLTNTLIFGKTSFSDEINTIILDATIEYIYQQKIWDNCGSF